jgi:manganese-dependent inorganic pyrophosphatase
MHKGRYRCCGIAGSDGRSEHGRVGLEMLKAGADVKSKTAGQLITLDAKEFQMGSSKVEIAQVNTVDVEEVFERQQELEETISKSVEEKGLDLFVFVVTDILNSDSKILVLGKDTAAAERAFKVELTNNTALLENVVSRKKQIVPVLNAEF